MELLIVVLIIAILLGLMIPNVREMRLRQRGQQSGQNLKTINMAIEQWVVDHYGVPDKNADHPLSHEEITQLASDPASFHLTLPEDGNHSFCRRISSYLSAKQHRIWVSPNRPGEPSYVYAPWVSSLGVGGLHPVVRAACFSLLDSNPRYEPRGYKGRVIPGVNIPASWANGYEDIGEWIPGTPRVNAY